MYAADNCKEKKCFRKTDYENFSENFPFLGKFCTGQIDDGKGGKVCCMKVIEYTNYPDLINTQEGIKKKRKQKTKKNA